MRQIVADNSCLTDAYAHPHDANQTPHKWTTSPKNAKCFKFVSVAVLTWTLHFTELLLRSAGWSWRLELEWCERKILLGWLELEAGVGVVWEKSTVRLELEQQAERSDVWDNTEMNLTRWWFLCSSLNGNRPCAINRSINILLDRPCQSLTFGLKLKDVTSIGALLE